MKTYNHSGKFPIVGRQGALCGNLNYAEGDFYATEHAVPVWVFGGTHPYWAFLCLTQMNLNQYATATAQPGLSVSKILDVYMPLPPIQEQKRIVLELERYECLIEMLEGSECELGNTIAKYRTKILELAISGKLVPQDPVDEPAEELLRRINPSAVPADKSHYWVSLPSSWQLCRVDELFDVNPKTHIDDETECGFIPMNLVNDGFSGTHQYKTRKWGEVKKGYCHLKNGDIGVAKISPCFENRKSVIFSSLPNNIGAGTTELVVLRSKGVYAPYYLYLMKSQWYIRQGTSYFKGVVGQQRVGRGIFTSLEIPLPPMNEQKRIVTKVEELFGVIDKIQQSLEA